MRAQFVNLLYIIPLDSSILIGNGKRNPIVKFCKFGIETFLDLNTTLYGFQGNYLERSQYPLFIETYTYL